MAHTHKKDGFSLVELAIVLVIIGLLAGGILTGQSLIRNAELQSAISEVQKYKDAVVQFQRQYSSLPGDMPDAINYWGTLAGNGQNAACFNASSVAAPTCNGNGNGALFSLDQSASDFAPEGFHAWKHLRNAEFIEGSFSGRREANPRQAVPGINVPRSTLDDGGYTILSLEANNVGSWWNGSYNPVFVFGKDNGASETSGALLIPEEAWNMDTKLDDGLPGIGKVRATRSATCVDDTVLANQNTAEYLLTGSNIACAVFFSLSDPGI